MSDPKSTPIAPAQPAIKPIPIPPPGASSSNFSWAQVLAPFAGALAGFLASRGMALPPGGADMLTGLAAAGVGAGYHWLETKVITK